MLFSGFFCFLCEERLVNYFAGIFHFIVEAVQGVINIVCTFVALLVIMLYSKLCIFTFGVATEVHCCLLNFISGS